MRRKVPPEDLKRADELLEGGASLREAARQTGVSADTLSRHRKPRPKPPPDPAPQQAPRKDPPPRARRRRVPPKPTDDQLVKMLSRAAVAPAVPMQLWVKCSYCAAHFVNTGPDAAVKLVELAEDHPELRDLLEWLWLQADKLAWAGALGVYAGVPVLHHLAPGPIYRATAPLLGMPPREHSHEPAGAPSKDAGESAAAPMSSGAAAGAATEPRPATGLEGMDLDQLMNMARSFGIDVDAVMPMLAANGSTAPAAPAEPAAEPAAGAAAEAADASPDPDPELGAT